MPEGDKSLMMEALYDLKQSGVLTLDIITGSGVNITPDWNAQIVFRNSKYELIPVKNLMDRPGQEYGEIAREEKPDEK